MELETSVEHHARDVVDEEEWRDIKLLEAIFGCDRRWDEMMRDFITRNSIYIVLFLTKFVNGRRQKAEHTLTTREILTYCFGVLSAFLAIGLVYLLGIISKYQYNKSTNILSQFLWQVSSLFGEKSSKEMCSLMA